MTENQKTGIVVGVVILAIIGAANNDNSGSGSGSDHSAAASACHDAVRPMLKSPATAHFHDDTFRKGQYDSTEVNGAVDSENGFGALLTSYYVCDVGADDTVIGEPTLIDGSDDSIYGGD